MDEIVGEVPITHNESVSTSREPTIKYSKELSDAPYTIDVNLGEMKRVLTDLGISPQKTGETVVSVQREPPDDPLNIKKSDKWNLLGSYVRHSNKIEVYADSLWRKYESLTEVCENVQEGLKDPKAIDKFRRDGIIITGRLSGYLEAAPPERAREFIKKLAIIGFQRNMTKALLHETAHQSFDENRQLTRLAGQFAEKVTPLILFSSPIIAICWAKVVNGEINPLATVPTMLCAWFMYNLGQNLGYKLSPEEMSARKFSKRFTDYPDLVKINRK